MVLKKKQNKYEKIFTNIAQNSLNHWIVQRATAVFLIPSILLLLSVFIITLKDTHFDVYNIINLVMLFGITFMSQPFLIQIFFFLIFSIIFIHFIEGFENIIQDYVHNEKSKSVIFLCGKCLQIELIKLTYLFIFL